MNDNELMSASHAVYALRLHIVFVTKYRRQTLTPELLDTLRDAFTSQPPHTVQEAVDRIETLTDIRRSPTQVRAWLKKTGLTVEKPAKARPKPGQSGPGRPTAIPGYPINAGPR